ncbi:MAG: AbrB family transcriptional regulator [Alphaproteobacteria bacterium]|nr:AbrB family transcriptional regulator [Alphaproteobacteria bacterium]
MSSPPPFQLSQLRAYGLSLGLGVAGGAIFAYYRLPLAWMIGAMCANTAASMLGYDVKVPRQLRALMIVVLGVLLGASFTPDLPARVGAWWPTLLALFAYVGIGTGLLFVYFHRLCGYDPATAYFASAPGGLNEMVAVGGAMGGDERMIALTQACRVLLVVLAIPFYFRFFGGYIPPASVLPEIGGGDLSLYEAGILVVCGVVGATVARLLRLPAYAMLGPMVLSAAAHMAGLSAATPPALLVAVAQVVLGSAVGARFAGTSVRQVRDGMLLSAGATAALMAVTVAFSLALGRFTGLSADNVLLAFSPGGLAEMSLVALALQSDAAFVATHHIARILIVITCAPLAFRLARRKPRPP